MESRETSSARPELTERNRIAAVICPDLTHTIAEGHDQCEVLTDLAMERLDAAVHAHNSDLKIVLEVAQAWTEEYGYTKPDKATAVYEATERLSQISQARSEPCDHSHCCWYHGTHTTPHKGCVLR